MKCKKIRKLISKYFDNILSEEEKKVMFEHIKECVCCNKEFNILSKIYNYLPEYKDVEISRSISDLVLSKIKNSEKEKVILWWRFVPTTAVLLVLMLTFIMVKSYKRPQLNGNLTYVLYPYEDLDLLELELIELMYEI